MVIFWFRRDLRLHDNAGLYHALSSGEEVQPLFIFDRHILDKLEDRRDIRVEFIHRTLSGMRDELRDKGSSILVEYGYPEDIFESLLSGGIISAVYTNHDYEPYATERDQKIAEIAHKHDVEFHSFKDQVVFEKDEIVKKDGEPYSVFTPYSRSWHDSLSEDDLEPYPTQDYFKNFRQLGRAQKFPDLREMGFEASGMEFPPAKVNKSTLENYAKLRDIPNKNGTTRISVHLRHGTVSIREMAKLGLKHSKTWLNELAWRDFYMAILWHHPGIVDQSFKKKYDHIEWRNNEKEFKAWCEGKTGYPIVDAGMRQMNETGYMHNRVRMIVASFLTKHLLIDWRWGEAYFGRKLLDYELSSNNGGWQWAAGSGCDAAPYFRVFNPYRQTERFDPENKYVRRWVPELDTDEYPDPIVDHKSARKRALDTYKAALKGD